MCVYGKLQYAQTGRININLCVERLTLSCLCAAWGSNFFWWFEEWGRRSSHPSEDAVHGFLVCPFYLLCTAEHLFYRDGELSLAAALTLPQSQPWGVPGLCVPVCQAGISFGSWTQRKELLGCGSARAGLRGEAVTW